VSDVYRDGLLYVRAEECSQCLYGPDRIVSGARAREITAATLSQEGSSFTCHRGAVYGEPEAICAGWWDRFADEHMPMRLAKALGIVRRVQ